MTISDLAAAAALFAGFVTALFFGSFIAPGKTYEGPVFDGVKPKYRMNGFGLFLGVAMAVGAIAFFRPALLAAPKQYFWPLVVVTNVFAFTATVVLAVIGRAKRSLAGKPTPPGLLAFIKDAFYGVEVAPTLAGIDLKLFSYRPSLMGLGLLNVSFAAAQYKLYGEVSGRMWLYQAFYFAYLFNYFQFEYGMIYTWDLIAERFGWMLVWGDYVLVPFFYSLPGWFLVNKREPLPLWQAGLFTALYVFGFVLFRGANEQKHQFKEDPNVKIWGKPAEMVGGKLLVSGFWGIGRKLNYTGELLMYTAWCLTTGFDSLFAYLPPIWLLCLFTHRAWRDEERCKAKYGPLWDEYCKRATFRMFPFLY